MNTWLSNFSEYKGLLNPLCITCIKSGFCKDANKYLNSLHEETLHFCWGIGYMKEDGNETKGRT